MINQDIGSYTGYQHRILTPCKVPSLFRKILTDDSDDLDPETDWILIEDTLILPLTYLRVTTGDALAGTSSGFVCEYEVIRVFPENIANIIEVVASTIGADTKLKEKFILALYCYINDPTADNLEILKQFKGGL